MTTKKNQGSALISAIFIMTLVAIAATAMSMRLQLDIYRTQLTIASDKLYLAAQVVSFWAMSELSNPLNRFTESDASGKVLNFPAKNRFIYPDSSITGALYDLQSRFNLNNVVDKKYHLSFHTFLKHTTKLTPEQSRGLMLNLLNWLTTYQPGQNSTSSIYYAKQKPPYYPGHQLMKNVSEFRLLEGVNAKLYRNLFDLITVLPEVTPVNLNTASRPLLMSLGYGLNEAQLNELLRARGKKGIQKLEKVAQLLKKMNIPNEQVTLESRYFMSVANVASKELNLYVYTVIKRNKDRNGKTTVSILNQSLNTFG